ncbi:uncharacterized protein ifng1 [Cynoglossus semilaevis]|uniref:Uncharacterized LOC103382524 n=1 Tax=Cynoglossus semilaevis TaxID=244447 RepID=A0A3P8UXI1_CYNSE|nr:uncharacterized protein LOC103382524 [Cynoglossus semilaevis]
MVSSVRAVVCLSLWLTVCRVSASHIPVRMNKTIQNLLLHYKISAKEKFNGKPVFSRELLEGKMEEKHIFIGGVLETYEQLIDQMLQQLPEQVAPTSTETKASADASASASASADNVRTDLNFILTKIQRLRRDRYQEQTKLLQGLQNLKKINFKDFVVQSKALWELPWLYEEASSLPHQKEMQRKRRRRRRQTRRGRNPARNMTHN